MDAQEAIKLAEAKIKRLENMMQVGIERNLLDASDQNEIKKDIEAEKIILKSTKLFHALIEHEGVNLLDDEKYPHAHDVYINRAGLLTIKANELAKIGIEVDDNAT